MNSAAIRFHSNGFSMIEVLISVVILLVGLLGLAGLQVRSQQAEMESYQRAQALILLQDMVDRINTNRAVAPCYAITSDTSNGSPYFGASSSAWTTCTSGTLEQQGLANADMTAWDAALKGAGENSSGSAVGAMNGARGCVTKTGVGTYVVAVSWQGTNDTVAPGVACGNTLYGNETQRRTISLTLRIADLTG